MRRRGLFLLTVVSGILVVTLIPAEGTDGNALTGCLLCGERGVADAILNVLLFVPLGAGLTVLRRRNPVVWAGLLSLIIEGVQYHIPGRDASPGDVLFNTIGASVGWAAARYSAGLLFPTPTRRHVLYGAALVLASGLIVAPRWLLMPAFPDSVYYALWTPRLGHLDHIEGAVHAFSLGDLPLDPGLIDRREVVRRIAAGHSLRVAGVIQAWPDHLGPVVGIFDDAQREILLIGAFRDRILFRFRTNATRLRLDQPAFQWPNAPGARQAVVEWRLQAVEGGVLLINSGAVEERTMSPAVGWTVLLYPEEWPLAFLRFIDLCWLALLLFPVGFWFRGSATEWLMLAIPALSLRAPELR